MDAIKQKCPPNDFILISSDYILTYSVSLNSILGSLIINKIKCRAHLYSICTQMKQVNCVNIIIVVYNDVFITTICS